MQSFLQVLGRVLMGASLLSTTAALAAGRPHRVQTDKVQADEEGNVFATEWARAGKSQTRLLAVGTLGESGMYRAGFEIKLDPNTITYWRTPGDAGAPPVLSFEGSQNVADAKMLFPAPQRINQGGILSYGYRRSVIFPIELSAKDPAQPVRLHVKVDYESCERVCIPNHVQADLALPRTRMFGPFEDAISSYQAHVPTPQPVGLDLPLTVTGVAVSDAGGKSMLTVAGRAPEGTKLVNLFAEAPADFALEPGTVEMKPDGTFDVPVAIASAPKGADLAKTTFTFTVVAGDRAIEVAAMPGAKDVKPDAKPPAQKAGLP